MCAVMCMAVDLLQAWPLACHAFMLIKREIGICCGVPDCMKLRLVLVSFTAALKYAFHCICGKCIKYYVMEFSGQIFKAGFLNSVFG